MNCFGFTRQNTPCRNIAKYGGFCHLHFSQTTLSQTEMSNISKIQKEINASYRSLELLHELEVLCAICNCKEMFLNIKLPDSSCEAEILLLSYKKLLTKKSQNIAKHYELDIEIANAEEELKKLIKETNDHEHENTVFGVC